MNGWTLGENAQSWGPSLHDPGHGLSRWRWVGNECMPALIAFALSAVFGLFWGCKKPVPAPLREVLGECQQEGLCEGVCKETLAPAPTASQVPTYGGRRIP